MTKYLICLLLLLSCCKTRVENKVDRLKTDTDVKRFLTEINKTQSEKIDSIAILPIDTIIKNCDPIVKTWNLKSWEKLDINNDGLTDLLFISYDASYLAIDKGHDHFEIVPIYYSPGSSCEFATVLKENNANYIIFHNSKFKNIVADEKEANMQDTLTYRFNSLIEVNDHPANYDIDSISFTTGACFGTCPIFEIKMDKAGNAVYDAGMYSKKEGTFTCNIKKQELAEIHDIINYISIKNLNDHYAVNWTDFPTCWIRVKFHDGSVKEIKDYGERGTFGLRKLYDDFFDLRDNQKWLTAK